MFKPGDTVKDVTDPQMGEAEVLQVNSANQTVCVKWDDGSFSLANFYPFSDFILVSRPLIVIRNDDEYNQAIKLMNFLIDEVSDLNSGTDPLKEVLEKLSGPIEKYESERKFLED